jgi:signal transduction histidine kinase
VKLPPFIRQLLSQTWNIISAVSVRAKILGMALGLVLLLGAGITVQVRASLASIMQEQLDDKSITTTRDLAARATDPILLNDLVNLQKLLLETQGNNPDVRYAFIIDADGHVLAHTFGLGFPIGLLDANTVSATDHHHTVVLQTEDGLVWDTAVPIFDGRTGTARVGLSDARLRQSIQAVTNQILLTIVLVVGFGVLVATSLTWVLTRPILALVSVTHAVSKGDFSVRVQRWAEDEIGELAEAFNAMTAELARTDELRRDREELRRQLLERVIATQEDERKRIARELHDSTSQNLTSLMVGIKTMSSGCQDPAMLSEAEKLRTVAAQTLDEIHNISMRLRPRLLDDIGLSAALEKLVNEWQARYKTPVDLLLQCGPQRMPAEIETAIYRIVQEALTNIARHASAQSVSVLVEKRNGSLLAVIEDDGRGFDLAFSPGDRHLGLVGMRERAELLDGKLTIESSPESGTSVYVEIPLKEDEA